MRAVLQRVASAHVEVEGRVVSAIGPGILVLVGLLDTDTEADAEFMCRKILNTRLFPNEKTGKGWDLSVMQKQYEVLMVSQFTLYGQLKGNKLDFHVAMAPDQAKPFYESLVRRVSAAYRSDAVKDGVFGAMMKVHSVNDGPVTIQLDSARASAKEVDQSSNWITGVRAGCQMGKTSVGTPTKLCRLAIRGFRRATSSRAFTRVNGRLHVPLFCITGEAHAAASRGHQLHPALSSHNFCSMLHPIFV